MTPEQFEALCALLRIRGGDATQAARLVLVGGWTNATAARHVGCSPQAASQTVRSLRRGAELAEKAARACPSRSAHPGAPDEPLS